MSTTILNEDANQRNLLPHKFQSISTIISVMRGPEYLAIKKNNPWETADSKDSGLDIASKICFRKVCLVLHNYFGYVVFIFFSLFTKTIGPTLYLFTTKRDFSKLWHNRIIFNSIEVQDENYNRLHSDDKCNQNIFKSVLIMWDPLKQIYYMKAFSVVTKNQPKQWYTGCHQIVLT